MLSAELPGAVLRRIGPPHTSEAIRKRLSESLEALSPNIKIRVYYLHAPDRAQDYADVCGVINELYKAGHLSVFLSVLMHGHD